MMHIIPNKGSLNSDLFYNYFELIGFLRQFFMQVTEIDSHSLWSIIPTRYGRLAQRQSN
jgi:hypothetical protein